MSNGRGGKMDEKIFSDDDFRQCLKLSFSSAERVAIASVANAKIEKLLGPKVYGNIGEHGSRWGNEPPGTYIQENLTHEGYLFNIQPIEKKPCEHEPESESFITCNPGEVPVANDQNTYSAFKNICKHCGVKLKAKWEVVE